MEQIKNVVLVAVVLGLVVIGIRAWSPQVIIQQQPAPQQTQNQPPLGAGGPILTTDYFSVGGALSYYESQNWATGTTTACALQGPNATTSATIFVNQSYPATSTVLRWTLALAATQFATTTKIFTLPQAASTTLAVSTTSVIVGPNQYVTLAADAAVGTNMPLASTVAGTCTAQFRY